MHSHPLRGMPLGQYQYQASSAELGDQEMGRGGQVTWPYPYDS